MLGVCIFLMSYGPTIPPRLPNRHPDCSLSHMIQIDFFPLQTAVPSRPDLSAWVLNHADMPQPSVTLTDAERARLARLVSPEKRDDLERSFLAVRAGLAGHFQRGAADIVIAHNALGAPCLPAAPDIHLSVSRTEGWSAFAVSNDSVIGIDIERVRPIGWRQMLPMLCSPPETALLSNQNDGTLLPFYRLWTAKEAIMKATGQGFRLGAPGIDLPSDFILGQAPRAEVQVTDHKYRIACHLHGDVMTAIALTRT